MAYESPAAAGPSATNRSAFEGWDDVPLFMKTLPKELGGQGQIEDTTALDALQSLVYDGNPSEIAANFREQANELFKQKKYSDAVGFYTRALDELGPSLPIEERRTLWANRAAANLELKNYGRCLKDVSAVLSVNPPDGATEAWTKTTLKVLFRSAKALLGLEKYPEALDALDRMRLLEKEMGEQGDGGKAVREAVHAKMARKQKLDQERNERDRRRQLLAGRLREALLYRKVIFQQTKDPRDMFKSCPTDVEPPHFDPDSLPEYAEDTIPRSAAEDSSSTLSWQPPPVDTPLVFPLFVLQPLAKPKPTRDLCLAFHTDATFGDAREAMGLDSPDSNAYIATKKGRVLKVGNKLTLGSVLAAAGKEEGDGWELREGWALELVIVPKGDDGDAWIKQWKDEVKSGAAIL